MDKEIYSVENLTHEQIRQRINERQAMVIPLGGCEPFGGAGVMGVETECAAEVAREVARRVGALVAPAIPFGCSTPFMAFAGAAGVKPRTFVNMLCEVIHAYIFQGIEKIIIVSAAPFNKEPAGEAVGRLKKMYPKATVTFYDINSILSDETVCDRNDELLLSMYRYLRPDIPIDKPGKNYTHDKDKYKAWKRRGRDPEKFRKMCPDGLMLLDKDNISYESGRDCFEKIINAIQSKSV